MPQRDAVFPPGPHPLYARYAYSPAIRSGDLLFVSGQVGSRADGSPEPDFEAQVRLAFTHLEATLRASGCGFDDILDVTSFHTDPEAQFAAVMAVKSEVFPRPPYPNWTAIGVTWLAGFDFEIKVVARLPAGQSVDRKERPTSDQNKAILRRANAAVTNGDYDGFLAHCSDDVEWHFVGQQTLKGKQAVRQYIKSTYVEPPTFTITHLIAEDDFVTALGDIRIKDATGRVVHSTYCDVWRIRDGQLVELRAFVIEKR